MNHGGEREMKIVTPTNSVKEIQSLVEAGAGELYFGYLDADWTKKYGAYSGNRRENFHANYTDINEVREMVKAIKSYGLDAVLALNDRYTDEQFPMIREILEKICDTGVENVIIADAGLCSMVKEWEIPLQIHVSTGGGVMNALTVEFYKQIGVRRIIFPRQLSLEEMNNMAEIAPDLEYEIFGMYGRDPYIDSYCRFHHGIGDVIPNMGACGCMRLNSLPIHEKGKEQNGEAIRPFSCLNTLKVDGCAACVLPNVNTDRIEYIKVVGRGAKLERKLQAVKMMKKAIDLLDQVSSVEMYEAECKKMFKEIYDMECIPNNCYF